MSLEVIDIDELCRCVPDWPEPTPLMREVAALVDVLYGIPGCEVGGPLHIVTDDCNVQIHHLAFCWDAIQVEVRDDHGVGWWREEQEPEETDQMIRVGEAILWGLACMSEAERLCVTEQTYRDEKFVPWPPYKTGLSYWQEDVLDGWRPGEPVPEWVCPFHRTDLERKARR